MGIHQKIFILLGLQQFRTINKIYHTQLAVQKSVA